MTRARRWGIWRAADWRQSLVSDHAWTQCANQAGAIQEEAGGYFVEAAGFPRRAYLKPANPHPDAANRARAAREKLASDLAFDLGLCVPPVLLANRANPPAGCESAVAVTLVMYPRQWPWEQIRGYPLDVTPLGAASSPAILIGPWPAPPGLCACRERQQRGEGLSVGTLRPRRSTYRRTSR